MRRPAVAAAVVAAAMGCLMGTAGAGRIERDPDTVEAKPTGRDPLPDFGLGMDGVLTQKGVRITRVAAQGPMARCGLEVGDVIQRINGTPIRGADDWIATLSNSNGRFRIQVRDCRTGAAAVRDVDVR
jgi:S1-C subfamily serine protease